MPIARDRPAREIDSSTGELFDDLLIAARAIPKELIGSELFGYEGPTRSP